jgi:hypothetical protein
MTPIVTGVSITGGVGGASSSLGVGFVDLPQFVDLSPITHRKAVLFGLHFCRHYWSKLSFYERDLLERFEETMKPLEPNWFKDLFLYKVVRDLVYQRDFNPKRYIQETFYGNEFRDYKNRDFVVTLLKEMFRRTLP